MTRGLRHAVYAVTTLVASFWVVEAIDVVAPQLHLDGYGIVPREIDGLRGLAFAPFLHAGFAHVAANSVPFLVLGTLVYLVGARTFVVASVWIAVLGGLGTWLFGSRGVHLGASGVIFGYFGFLLVRGYYERRLIPLAVSVTVGVVYGGMFFGMLPGLPGISWEGHLFGFLAGAYQAKTPR